jgi:tRNA (adenine22-N1)-methyltransferase
MALLTPRLREIVNQIEGARTVADVGCDHGHVAVALVQEGRAEKVVASDVTSGSLQKAAALVKGSGLAGVETRLGDGLSVLEAGEADTVVVAGMGGALIERILREGLEKALAVRRLVLSPNRNEAGLRRFLLENGFRITRESLALDRGRYYQVICAGPGYAEPETDAFYYEVGRLLIEGNSPYLRGFLQMKIREAAYIMKRAARGKSTKAYVGGIREKKERMEEVLQCL